MKISLIIPTYNRPEKLRETLSAVARQTMPPSEIIVVDDGSTPENSEKAKRICSEFGLPCRFIAQKNSGASAALNNGVRNSTSDVIIIIDDDIILEPEAIVKHADFQARKGPCLLSGDAHTDPERATTDVEQYKIHMEIEWLKKRPDTQKLLHVNYDNFIVTTANTSFTREIFERIGGFDETLRDGYDVDFGIRALLKEIPVWFDRSIRSVHNDKITLRYYAKRQSLYDQSKKTILKKQPDLGKHIQLAPPQKQGTVRKVVYRILRKNNIVNFIEGSRLMLLLPKKLRYRIYGSTIAALCSTL